MYKVFIYDKPLLISNKPQKTGSFEQISETKTALEIIEKIENEAVSGLEIIVDDPKSYFKTFKKQFKYIKAAGGVVYNSLGEILVIHRIGKWDLPKGKLEKGEDIPTCAVREVTEECNVTGIEIKNELCSTYHCYPFKGKWALKRTYWFKMETDYNGDLIPQTEEGIEKVAWADADLMKEVFEDTYASIREVIGQVV